jgi:hypothetical protein
MKSTLLLIFIFSIANIAQSFNNSESVQNDSGLVAFYPFNGNAIDETGNGYNGNITGATLTSDRFNQLDKAYNFTYNGFSSDRIEVSGTSGLNFSSGEFSISAWVKFSGLASTGNNYPIFSKHICGEQSGYIVMLYNDKLTFWLAGSSGYNVLSTPDDYTDNSWHQVVAVYDGVTQAIYVDGLLKNSVAFSYNIFSSANWALGGYNGCNGGFNGKVDEIEVFNRALTASEILEKYNQSANHLVAFYPFNGNANDESGNGHDGTVNGGVLTNDRFNHSNSAYTFQIPHSNIVLDNSTSLNFENGFTLNAWVKYKNINSTIVGKHNCWVENGFLLSIDNNQFRFLVANSVWSEVRTNEAYDEDQWYMVTGVYDHFAGVGKLYVNGLLKSSGPVVYNNYSTAPVTISEPSNGCPENNMPGVIDEIKIYDRSLTDEEILSEYNLSRSDLVLFLPFNGNADDESGNNNNGVITGASITQDRFGIDGRAYSFDGVDDYITIADNPNLFSDEMTISWWYNMSEYDNSGAVIGWVDGGNRYQQFFAGTTFSYFNGYSGSWFNPTYTLTNLNEWVHILVTYKKTDASSSTTSLFVNGELKQTDNNPIAMTYAQGINFYIGRNHTPGVEFKGKLDDFRIYNRVLETSEVLALYIDSTTYYPPIAEDSLVAYYAFNSTTNDSSGNGNNGINNNGVYSKDRYGFENNSMYFNGVDSYVEGINPGNNLPVGNSPRTFSAWIKNYEYNQWGSNIFHYGTAEVAPTNFHFLITNVLGLGNGYGYSVVYGNTNLNDSLWHFVAGVYEGGTERITKLYVDGKLDSVDVLTTEPNTVLGNNWRIGQFIASGTPFKGNIDELKVFNMALSDQKILEIYKIGTTAPDLILPENNSTINTLTPGFYWDSSVVATSYQIIISSDSNFTSIVLDETIIRMYYIISSGLLNTDINYYWKVRTINDGGIGPWSDEFNFKIVITDVEDEQQLPTEFELLQNYPNPFNPTSTITYHLPKTSKVELKVYDVLGNEVATLIDEEKMAGSFEVDFNPASSIKNLATGIYFYRLRTADFIQTKKMVYLK